MTCRRSQAAAWGDPIIVCCFSYGVPTGLGPPHIQVVSLSFA